MDIDILEIVCEDIKVFNKFYCEDNLVHLFSNSSKEFQISVIEKLKDDESVHHIINNIEKSNSKTKLTLIDVYHQVPSVFENRYVLDMLYEKIKRNRFDEDFLVKIFDVVYPKVCNISIDEYAMMNMMGGSMYRMIGWDMYRKNIWDGFGRGYEEKDHKYYYRHKELDSRLTKSHKEYQEKFLELRSDLFKNILKIGSYSLDFAKKLGYEKEYNEVYSTAWVSKTLKEKTKLIGIKGIEVFGDYATGKGYIKINRSIINDDKTMPESTRVFFRESIDKVIRYSNNYFEIKKFDPKCSFAKIMIDDISIIDNGYLYTSKFTMFDIEDNTITLSKDEIAKKLGIEPANLVING